MTIRPWALVLTTISAGLLLGGCPAEAPSGPETTPSAEAPPPAEPSSQPSSLPSEHSTSTTPVSLEDLFRMPETPPVVLKVGTAEVKRETLENKLRQMQLQLTASGIPEGTTRQEVLRGAVDQLIEYEFTMLMARQLGAKVDKKAVDAWVKDLEDRMEAEPAFKALLARAGNTREQREMDARFMLTAEAVAQKLLERMRTKTSTSLRAYYDSHLSDFTLNAGTEMWRIHVKAPMGMTQKDRDTLRLRAEDIAAKAKKNPKDFESLAKHHSEGGNAHIGGYLGYVGRGTFAPELEAQLFAAKPNSVLPLYEDPSGFYIYKVGKSREKRVKKYEEVEPEIFEIFARGFLHKEVEKERGRLRAATPIEVHIAELTGAPAR